MFVIDVVGVFTLNFALILKLALVFLLLTLNK